MDVKQCEEYKGNICDQLDYDDNNKTILVYVGKRYNQNQLESHLQKIMVKLDNHPYVSCIPFIKQVLCRRFFPVCRQKHGKAHLVQKTCREDCERAKNSVCYSAVKRIPELSKRLLEASCMTLPFEGCLILNIPSMQTTTEQTCQLTNYKVGSKSLKVSILRNFIPLSSSPVVPFKDKFIAGGPNCQQTKCVHTQTFLSHLVKDLNVKNIKKLQNLVIEQQKGRFINGYCYKNCSTEAGYIQLLKTRIGNIKKYAVDKHLTLRDVDVYIERNLDGMSITGKGVYDLCGTTFRYKLWPESEEVTVMHSISNQSINMLNIELSHRLKPFPREIESILTYKIKVIETLNISDPTWSIVWYQENRFSAFKGISTISFEREKVKNVKTELMIGADLSFWVVKLTLQLNLEQILRSVFPVSIERLPFINKRWYTELRIEQVEYIFSTDSVDIPTTEYLNQHYSLYGDFQNGKIHRGMNIRLQGKTQRPNNGTIELPLLKNKTLFHVMIDVKKNGRTNFEMQFQEDATASCSNNKKNRRHWKNFIRRLKAMQTRSNHTENAIIETKTECGHCCDSNAFTLLSIECDSYQEHRFVLTHEINYFVDFEVRILVKDMIHKYVTKRYKVYSI